MRPMSSQLARYRSLAVRGSALVGLTLLAACATGDDPDQIAGAGLGSSGALVGALIDVRMDSQVGVLLDELPGSLRQRVATAMLARPASFWRARAEMQIETTAYQLSYRNAFYVNKGQLPLSPRQTWNITVGTPVRKTIDGHDLVVAPYSMQSTLLTSLDSPAKADKALEKIGGTWNEGFVLPVDPEMLLERTGYACMDEEDFPPNSVDSENAREFYDQTCKKGTNGCHVTLPVPVESCIEALKAHVGRVSTAVRFRRLPWSQALADSVRVGGLATPGAELEVIAEGLENNRIIYRYIQPGSCAIEEGCVGGSGWRRLLQFDASVRNLGGSPAAIGDVSTSSLPVQHNMFEYSACHGHLHFSHYGNFAFDNGDPNLGSKRAFCLESVTRYSNNETTPLTHPYNCHYQGIEAGWGDDYIAGIECQWVDVTTVNTTSSPVTAPLRFVVNPDGFLCEGTPILDAKGNFTFEPTQFMTEDGKQVDRIACNERPDAGGNNSAALAVTLPTSGGYVTAPCSRDQQGPSRNCGFVQQGGAKACSPGKTVKLECSVGNPAAPAVARFCEASTALGAIPCTAREALSNKVVGAGTTQVTFTCPNARDGQEVGGSYGLYVTPAFSEDPTQTVSCVVK